MQAKRSWLLGAETMTPGEWIKTGIELAGLFVTVGLPVLYLMVSLTNRLTKLETIQAEEQKATIKTLERLELHQSVMLAQINLINLALAKAGANIWKEP